ncbi:MAG: DUF3147 family protein [Gammaproteobacteria bacterium]|nr:DUF3147 family protein [Gammaproteobacteria bacterium]
MLYTVIKVFISAILIVAVSEVAKRSTLLGALLASLPITSLLAIIWLYLDTHNTHHVAALSQDILWLVIPSLLFFITLPILLHYKLHFYWALGLSCMSAIVAYAIMLSALHFLRH